MSDKPKKTLFFQPSQPTKIKKTPQQQNPVLDFPKNTGDWFAQLIGTPEELDVKPFISFNSDNNTIVSRINKKEYFVGEFSTPSLKQLREKVSELREEGQVVQGRLVMSHIVGDVADFHAQKENKLALFQAASQFNCLEFVNPSVTPEEGVTGYVFDRTQGPACAIACGAATIYRNHLVTVPILNKKTHQPTGETQIGQSKHHQLDMTSDMTEFLESGGEVGRFYSVKGGYMVSTKEKLSLLNQRLSELEDVDKVRERLKVGVHYGAEVTGLQWGRRLANDKDQRVTQVFGSACAVAYSAGSHFDWQNIAKLILEASYEATLCAAVINATKYNYEHASNVVFLTALGGGVFGNNREWIAGAIKRAIKKHENDNLDVRIVSFRVECENFIQLVEEHNAAGK